MKINDKLKDLFFQIEECVQNHFKTKPAEFWLEKLEAARIPHAPVNDFEHALKDPQVLSREMVVDIPHTDGGSFKAPGNPVKLGDHIDTWESPPKLGEHTNEILRDFLDKTEEDINKLRTQGIIA